MTRHQRGFSLVEMLIAMTISSLLLTATLGALDALFKSYKVTTESASTHVVMRLVMQRLGALIRTGESFGPFPSNPIITPVITSDSIEFRVQPDPAIDAYEIWTVSLVDVVGPTGPNELRTIVERYGNGSMLGTTERTIMRRVLDATFTLRYDVGPRLRRATIDLTVLADDVQGDTIGSDLHANALRMVTTISPRRLD